MWRCEVRLLKNNKIEMIKLSETANRITFNSNSMISFFGILILCALFNLNSALYEDQVGKFDWRQQYIGNVISIHFDHSVGSHKIIVATEENVLAALNQHTNQTIWRQVLESNKDGKIVAIAANGNAILSVSGENPLVRSWDSTTGILNWETSLTSSTPGSLHNSLYRFRVKDSLVVVAECQEYKSVTFKSINYQTGELRNSQKIPAPWFLKNTKCQFTSDSFFVCLDETQPNNSPIFYTFDINKDTAFHPLTLSSLGLIDSSFSSSEIITLISGESSREHLFAIKSLTNQVVVVDKVEDALRVVEKFSNVVTLSATNVNDHLVLCLLTNEEQNYVLEVYDTVTKSYLTNVGGAISYPEHYGVVQRLFAEVLPKKDGSLTWRVVLTTSCHSILYFNAGLLQWTREESLASIMSVEMVDLPISESEAQMEEQFGSANVNVMVLFLKRLTTQLVQLQTFLSRVLLNIQSETGIHGTETDGSIKLIRDEFDIHKVIVIVTSTGKIFGMDSFTGKIIWRKLVKELHPFSRYGRPYLPLYVLRTTAHYPHSPSCAVMGVHRDKTVVFNFNPITGEPIGDNEGVTLLNFQVIQAIQLSFYDSEFLRGLLLIDSNYKVRSYPNSYYSVALQNAASLYTFLADVSKGGLTGYSLADSTAEELILNQMWSIKFPVESQLVTNVVMKRNDEHVHSQGRAMGDRSVLYKYLNPNLAVVTTESVPGPHHQSSLNVYLVDVVSGQIVFSANHKRAKGPVHIIHSENWVVYSYMSEKFRRIELTVLELYEGKTQSNTTYFSSLSPPLSPMIERQAYVFYTHIDALAVTITQKGITAKHLLFALPGGGILELPKAYLDPRRSLIPTIEQREEGIMPYNPELPILTENIINYNQTLYRVRNIYTAPTGLESTCLVLAYGLDLFYTRVTPSRTFDVLKDDFDHWIIVMALTGLLVASYITKKFAAKKALKQAWK
ncbi:hypothetical protein CHUAL_000265 [Chamberlinius hualienensis]